MTSFVTYPGQSGGTTDYTVSFPYLDRDHIVASVDGASAPFTFISDTIIRFDTAPVGDVQLSRQTPLTPVVAWSDTTILRDDELNTMTLQAVYLAEEAQDYYGIAKENADDAVVAKAAAEAAQAAAEAARDIALSAKAACEASEASVTTMAAAVAASEIAAATSATASASSASQSESERIAAQAARVGAEAAQSASETAQAGSESVLADFNTKYLGPKASDPSVDNNGDPLVTGALYFNTASMVLKAYNGSSWVVTYTTNNGFLVASNNLSDIQDGAVARSNLVVYSKSEIDTALGGKANSGHTHSISEITDAGSLASKNDAPSDGLLYVRMNGVWVQVPSDIGAGTFTWFLADTPPSGWLELDGSTISRTTYADLFAKIGTEFGAGDGSTTFDLPDLRSEFIRGWDHGRGVDSGRVFGSFQDHSIGSQDFEAWAQRYAAYAYGGNSFYVYGPKSGDPNYGGSAPGTYGSALTATDYGESRPRNISLLPIVKY